MKRALLFAALLLVGAAPLLAQTNEFGVLVGGSRRFVKGGGSVKSATGPAESDWIESNFSFSNNFIELYWSVPIEPELNLKFKGGAIDTQIAIPYEGPDPDDPDEIITLRRDREGQVQHLETVVEYKFEEPFGSSGLFAGLGYYRLTAPNEDDQTTWGITAGANADFPITRRYGVVIEGSYHWTRAEFSPRFLTLGGGLRISF
jgi:opacity protein-like surface antigen